MFGLSAVEADPQQTLEEVQTQVDDLHEQAAEANERHNVASEEHEDAQRALNSAKSRVDRQTERLDALTAEVGVIAAAAYRGGGIEPTVSALMSDDIGQYLADASTLDAYTNLQSNRLEALAAERISLEQARLMAAEQERRLEKVEQTLRTERNSIEELLAEQQDMLDRLTSGQQAELRRQEQRERAAALADRSAATYQLSRSSADDRAPASDRAATAVEAALAKVGNGYSYGAAGPDVFDCSGFTGWAYGTVGVSLPRSSSAQYGVGTPVSADELAPGDLLFYGSPISHVAMYIGNGTVVHASNPRTGVTTAAAMQAGGSAKPFVGAKRP
jgi:cell wall-associated NlpC family hydrolase